jgi:hypothetical protein
VNQALQKLRAGFEREASTRGFALYRLLLVAVVFFYTTKASQFHPGYVEAPPLRQLMGLLMMVSAWLAWLGFQTRVATAVLAFSWGFLHLKWGMSERPGQLMEDAHMLQALVVLALSPCGRSLSLDRWLAVRRAEKHGQAIPPEMGPVWPAGLMIISLSCMYTWIFLGLATPTWFSGFAVEQIWLSQWASSDAFARHPELAHFICLAIAWIVLALTLVLAVGLLLPRFRVYMIALGVGLQLCIWPVVGMWPLTLTMLLVYAAIIPPEAVHRFFEVSFDLRGEDEL